MFRDCECFCLDDNASPIFFVRLFIRRVFRRCRSRAGDLTFEKVRPTPLASWRCFNANPLTVISGPWHEALAATKAGKLVAAFLGGVGVEGG